MVVVIGGEWKPVRGVKETTRTWPTASAHQGPEGLTETKLTVTESVGI